MGGWGWGWGMGIIRALVRQTTMGPNDYLVGWLARGGMPGNGRVKVTGRDRIHQHGGRRTHRMQGEHRAPSGMDGGWRVRAA